MAVKNTTKLEAVSQELHYVSRILQTKEQNPEEITQFENLPIKTIDELRNFEQKIKNDEDLFSNIVSVKTTKFSNTFSNIVTIYVRLNILMNNLFC